MKRAVSSLSFVLFAGATALRAQNTMTAEVTAAYNGVSANILHRKQQWRATYTTLFFGTMGSGCKFQLRFTGRSR